MRIFTRLRTDPPFPALTSEELTALATYNAECYRGLVHTEEYAEHMAALQARFDAERT